MHIVEFSEGDFRALPPEDRGWTDPLVVYTQKDSHSETLVLFVHGLGGRSDRTWGHYPEFILSERPETDVGLFDYESGTRRRVGRSLDLDQHTKTFAHCVRDLDYRHVILVGHSMGGLLCKSAITNLLDSGTRDSNGVSGIGKVAGLILFATPQSGSRRVPRLIARVTKDGKDLRVGSKIAANTAQRFIDRVSTDINIGEPTVKQRLPTFAIIANADRWVDPLSASMGIHSDQQKVVTGTHISIVKPKSRNDDAYTWFELKLSGAFSTRRRSIPAYTPN